MSSFTNFQPTFTDGGAIPPHWNGESVSIVLNSDYYKHTKFSNTIAQTLGTIYATDGAIIKSLKMNEFPVCKYSCNPCHYCYMS